VVELAGKVVVFSRLQGKRKGNYHGIRTFDSRRGMSGEIFTDSSMLEIFRAEVETHVESLTSGLLALERNPGDTSHVDEMMRGAHSIKGAARIVGIDPAVRVAHVMEDGFVAAQNGKLTLRPEHVDVLLRGVDMLNRIANASKAATVDWKSFDDEALPLVSEITAVLAGKPVAAADASMKSAPSPSLAAAETVAVETVTAETAPNRSAHDLTIHFPARIDTAAAENARLEFVAGLDQQRGSIRLDLSKTVDLDATGLAFLAAIPAQIAQGGPVVELSGVGTDLKNLFKATGIDQLYSTGGH
jgi:two-component system sensor histidine kinase and response regulator WspE